MTSSSRLRLAVILAAAPILASCTVGPEYVAPEIAPPADFAARELADTKEAMANITPALEWWKGFGDPVLDDLIARALAKNNSLEAAKERLRAARAIRRASAAPLLPSAGINAGASKSRATEWGREAEAGGGPVPGADTISNSYSAGAQVTWEIDLWGKNRRGYQAAQQDVLASEYEYRAAVLALIGDVAQGYFDALAARENLKLVEEEVKNRSDFLDLIRMRERGGLNSRLDTRRQEVEVAAVKAQVPQAREQYEIALYRLAVLLGEAPGAVTLAATRDLADYPTLPVLPQSMPVDLMRQRPDVLRAEAQTRAAFARIGQRIGEMLPRVGPNLSGGYRSAESEELFTEEALEWSWGAALDVPLFDGGAGAARTEAARSDARAAAASYKETFLQALRESNEALARAVKGRERREALLEQLAAAEDAQRIAYEQYRAGVIDLLDYLDATRTTLQVRQVVIAADARNVADVVATYRALGGGWESAGVDVVEAPTKSTGRKIAENFPLFAAGLDPLEHPAPKGAAPAEARKSDVAETVPAGS
jgi:multidrug efflux system outer membrane protein